MNKKLIGGAIAGVIISIGAIFGFMQMNKDYIGGNVLHLPYKSTDDGNDMKLVTPWVNNMMPTLLLFRTLLLPDKDLFYNFKPNLASSIDVLEDGLLYQVNFNTGNKWSDGVEITLEDVIWSIENVVKVQRANPYYFKAFGLIESMEVDGNKLNIRVSQQSNIVKPFLAQLAIMPKHAMKDIPMEEIHTTDYWFNPVASGMYRVGEYSRDKYYKLVHNENYNGTKPKIEEVYLHNTLVSTHKYDHFSTHNISEMMNFRALRNYQEYPLDMVYYRYLAFNIGGTGDGYHNPAMEDKRIRQAICMAIDRDKLLHNVYVGYGRVVNGAGLADEYGPHSYNPIKAKELIAQSGYDLKRPLRFGYYNMDNTTQEFLQAAKKMLEEVGFIVELLPQQGAQKLIVERQYDFYLKGFGATRPIEWFEEYSNPIMKSIMGYQGELADLVAKANVTSDKVAYDNLLKEAVRIEDNLLYKFPLFNLTQTVYINIDRLQLPKNTSFGNHYYLQDYNFENWEIKKQ